MLRPDRSTARQLIQNEIHGPSFVRSQPFQPISNLLVLVTQDRAVAIASLPDLERAAGKCNTGPPA